MKWMTLGFTFLLVCSPCSATYLGLSVYEHDVLGCHENSNNPRCKKIKLVACKTICHGHEDDNSRFGTACRDMCKLPLKESNDSDTTQDTSTHQ